MVKASPALTRRVLLPALLGPMLNPTVHLAPASPWPSADCASLFVGDLAPDVSDIILQVSAAQSRMQALCVGVWSNPRVSW